MRRHLKREPVTRRDFVAAAIRATGAWASANLIAGAGVEAEEKPSKEATPDIIAGIERSIIWNGRAGGTTWFHPRACMIPGPDRRECLMTLQSITGSDVFGPVHWSVTRDLGKTWSDPQPISSLGRHSIDKDMEEGVCDVVPEYHKRTNTVLAIGHNVYYKKGVLAKSQLSRWPVYVVRSPDGTWSQARKLEWDDPRTTSIYTCGCAQRITLPNGELLVPLAFGPKERTDRSVCSAVCSFDGTVVSIKKVGNELRNPVRRGLLEPSLAALDGRFYMTIRAEDEHGYVTVSDDGLNWEKQRPWCWDDGQPLAMSTTQQRWLVHSDGLYLVYTRRSETNAGVFRWRAPLYAAMVDRASLRLIRATERVVFPLIGDGINDPKHVARMGNFHTVAATPEESWITSGEERPEDGWRGDLLMARVRWTKLNRLA